MNARIYLSGTGQRDNIGDALLRRGLIRSLREANLGELHVLTSGLPAEYIRGLRLDRRDVSYEAASRWRACLLRDAVTGRAAYGFNAGEINNSAGKKFSRRPARVARIANRRGRGSFWTGIGVRETGEAPSASFDYALRSFSLIAWRDEPSRDFAGTGSLYPDWAFAEGASDAELRAATDRDLLAVTMRGDRPEPADSWYELVKRLAGETESQIVVVSQVRRDSAMNARIAARLNAQEMPWQDQDFSAQEEVLRTIYRRSRAVISDRLHAVIMGATEGAVPLGLASPSPEKIDRTLAAVDLSGFTLDSGNPKDSGSLVERMVGQIHARELVVDQVDEARRRLSALTKKIALVVTR